MIRIGDIVLGKLDLREGRFTYGNRIAIGMIFADGSLSEYQKLKAAHRELYGYSCRLLPMPARRKRLDEIVQAMLYWIEREKTSLDYTPTADEQAAGIAQFNKEVGVMGTIKALAKAYGEHPNNVLKWDYATVFEILRTDLAEVKYNRRFSAVARRNTKKNGNNTGKR